MIQKLRLKLTNGWVAAVGVFSVGLLPCPDCGIPLAAHVWPVAGIVWLYRRVRRRSLNRLDLLLTDDLAARVPAHIDSPITSPDSPAPQQ